jgi:hypothetical protein
MKHDKKAAKKDKDKLKTKSKAKAPATKELSEEQLERVAGGAVDAFLKIEGESYKEIGTAITITGTTYKE